MTSHCPRCELVFGSRSELEWHLREEHGWGPGPGAVHAGHVGWGSADQKGAQDR